MITYMVTYIVRIVKFGLLAMIPKAFASGRKGLTSHIFKKFLLQ